MASFSAYVFLFSGCHVSMYPVRFWEWWLCKKCILLTTWKDFASAFCWRALSLNCRRRLAAWRSGVCRYVCFSAADSLLVGVCTAICLSLASVSADGWRADWFLSGRLIDNSVVPCHGRSFDLELWIGGQCLRCYFWTSAGWSDFFLWWEGAFWVCNGRFHLLRNFSAAGIPHLYEIFYV